MPITVITTTYNVRRQLLETIESLRFLRQFVDEFIVIDGASNDGTCDLIRADPLITAWRSEPDRGIYDAMNKGWLLANPSNHILYLGAGDRLLSPPATEELLPGTVVYGTVELENGRSFVSKVDEETRRCNTLHHQALLVPRSLHPASPFNTRYPVYADYDFNLRLLRSGTKFARSASFRGYAAAGGASRRLRPTEMAAIVARNFGLVAGVRALKFLTRQSWRDRALVARDS